MATEWPLIVGPGRTDSFFPRTPFSSTVDSLYKPNHAVASPRQNRPRLERWTVDQWMIKTIERTCTGHADGEDAVCLFVLFCRTTMPSRAFSTGGCNAMIDDVV